MEVTVDTKDKKYRNTMVGVWKETCVMEVDLMVRMVFLRALERMDVAICVGCYESWERAGRKCGACGTVVKGPQEVSAFDKPRRTFGHADCGGMRLVR